MKIVILWNDAITNRWSWERFADFIQRDAAIRTLREVLAADLNMTAAQKRLETMAAS